jgi:hypothetical protein
MTVSDRSPCSGAAQRARYRAWVLAHHPDRGGDPAAFATGLAAWQQRLRADPAPQVVFVHRASRTPLSLLLRLLHRRRRPPRVR